MNLKFETYQLPRRDEVGDEIEKLYKAKSFPKEVSQWHIERLPQLSQSGLFILCPLCNKSCAKPGTQISHIIPVKQYARWVSIKKAKELKIDPNSKIDHQKGLDEIKPLVVNSCSDPDNLLILCSKCNNKLGDKMLDEHDFGDITLLQNSKSTRQHRFKPYVSREARRSDALRKKLENAKQQLDAIRDHKDKKYIQDGMSCRSPATWQERTEYFVNTYYRKRRPQLDCDWRTLARGQKCERKERIGKICYYCLGIYEDSAFTIDHINASLKYKGIAKFNQADNLIPVCASCNSSKGNKILTQDWLADRREIRAAAGIEGVEDVLNLRDDEIRVVLAKLFFQKK